MLEQQFAVEFDLDELPADDLTNVDALAEYVERKAKA
jgi:acyl carrier protein